MQSPKHELSAIFCTPGYQIYKVSGALTKLEAGQERGSVWLHVVSAPYVYSWNVWCLLWIGVESSTQHFFLVASWVGVDGDKALCNLVTMAKVTGVDG